MVLPKLFLFIFYLGYIINGKVSMLYIYFINSCNNTLGFKNIFTPLLLQLIVYAYLIGVVLLYMLKYHHNY